MTKPRQHLPGQVVLLTRRTEDRRYFLRPCAHVRSVVMFELAKAAEPSGVAVHALMTMSNHPHIVATDHRGERSDFMRDFLSGTARARNSYMDRQTLHFWDSQQFGDTVLLDRHAVEEKLLYTWLNPVRANLVERAEHWPGPKILPRDWGKPRVVTAPRDGFYDSKKARSIEFTPQPPPGYEDMTLDEVIAYFEALLREAEDLLIAQRRKAGKRVLGARAVQRVRVLDGPPTPARRSELNPRFASRNASLMERAQSERRQFHADYDAANASWRAGRRDTVFPAGTIRHRKLSRVVCRDPVGCEASIFHPTA